MGTKSKRMNKRREELRRKVGYHPKGTSYFWNKSIPEGYDFTFDKCPKNCDGVCPDCGLGKL